jgi:hypothetical protein
VNKIHITLISDFGKKLKLRRAVVQKINVLVAIDRISLRKLNPPENFRKAVRAHDPAHEPNGSRKMNFGLSRQEAPRARA